MNNGFRSFIDYCLVGIEVNEMCMKEYVEKSVGIIIVVNFYLGYEVVLCIVCEVILIGKLICEFCF